MSITAMRTIARAPMFRAIASRSFSAKADLQHLRVEKTDRVCLITLNRPKALNALCDGLISELNQVTSEMDADPTIGAMVITGSEKAFAAGADISEMAPRHFVDCYKQNMFADWGKMREIQKPIIAAVSGYALGGGCELAMMCDIIVASDTAKFGQPEITLGVIPGCGGTQRLIRAVGKSKAMEMILTGKMIDAEQAERDGLVSKVVPGDELIDSAVKMASKIASFSEPVVGMCKETVNAAYEMTLGEGLRFERRIFHSAFALDDQKEGMSAFLEKRKPTFTHK